MRVYRVPGVPETSQAVAWVGGLSFAPDARRLAVIGSPHVMQSRADHPAVRWLDLAGGEVCRALLFHYRQPFAVALSPDHSLLGTGQLVIKSGQPWALIERYELPNPNPALVWEIANYYPRAAACAPDGSGFAVALDNREPYSHRNGEFPYAVCGWDGRTGSKVGPVPLSWWPAAALAFSSDGRWLACAGRGGRVMILDWPGGECVGEFFAPLTERIRFAPDRPHLAVVAKKSVVVFDASAVRRRSIPSTVPRLATLQRGHRDWVADAAFSPAGDQLLTVSADETARVWSLAKRRCVRCFEWGIGPLSEVAWSPDGLLCAAAGAGGQIVVWDMDG